MFSKTNDEKKNKTTSVYRLLRETGEVSYDFLRRFCGDFMVPIILEFCNAGLCSGSLEAHAYLLKNVLFPEGGGRITSYNCLYGEALKPKTIPFSGSRYMKGSVKISLFEVTMKA